MKRITLNYLKAEVRRLTDDEDETGPGFQSTLVLLASLRVGTSIKALAKFTGLPRARVAPWVKRAREQGIFTRHGRITDAWFKEGGGVAVIADSLVVCGLLNRGKSGVERAAASDYEQRALRPSGQSVDGY